MGILMSGSVVLGQDSHSDYDSEDKSSSQGESADYSKKDVQDHQNYPDENYPDTPSGENYPSETGQLPNYDEGPQASNPITSTNPDVPPEQQLPNYYDPGQNYPVAPIGPFRSTIGPSIGGQQTQGGQCQHNWPPGPFETANGRCTPAEAARQPGCINVEFVGCNPSVSGKLCCPCMQCVNQVNGWGICSKGCRNKGDGCNASGGNTRVCCPGFKCIISDRCPSGPGACCVENSSTCVR